MWKHFSRCNLVIEKLFSLFLCQAIFINYTMQWIKAKWRLKKDCTTFVSIFGLGRIYYVHAIRKSCGHDSMRYQTTLQKMKSKLFGSNFSSKYLKKSLKFDTSIFHSSVIKIYITNGETSTSTSTTEICIFIHLQYFAIYFYVNDKSHYLSEKKDIIKLFSATIQKAAIEYH